VIPRSAGVADGALVTISTDTDNLEGGVIAGAIYAGVGYGAALVGGTGSHYRVIASGASVAGLVGVAGFTSTNRLSSSVVAAAVIGAGTREALLV